MQRLVRDVVLTCAVALAAGPALAAGRCDGGEVLRRAAAAYRRLGSLSDTVQYSIRVPGAPERHETTEFGFDREVRAVVRMPGLYLIAVKDDRLYLTADPPGPSARLLERRSDSPLQGAVDAAFEGHGPPLVPVPLLLRAEADPDGWAQAFRLRLLHHLHVAGCQPPSAGGEEHLESVALEADNGVVHASFRPQTGLLARFSVSISTGSDSAPVTADASFAPHPGQAPARPTLQGYDGLQRVPHFADLAGEAPEVPADPLRGSGLQTLDAQPAGLERFAGEVTILEFWATWCAPCRFTLPSIASVAAWAEASHLPVHVVLVNTAEEFESVQAARPELVRFLTWAKVSLPTVVDLDGSFHRRFGGGLPLTLVISRDGRVVGRYGGYQATLEQTLRRQVTDLLRAPAPATSRPAADGVR